MSLIRKEQEKNVDRLNAYFVGKHGNDTLNNGLSDDESFLTDDKGLTEIQAKSPSSSNQYAIISADSGVYDGSANMNSITYTHIYKPNATIRTDDGSINSVCTINVNTYIMTTYLAFAH